MNAARPDTYDLASRVNHWIVALVMISMLAMGLVLENVELEREVRGQLMGLHKAVGATFLVFALWRVGYRLAQGFPAPAAPTPAWSDLAAKAVHWALLVGVLAMPISGLMMSLFGGRDVDLFGLATIPAFEKNEALAGAGHLVHGLAAKILLAAIALHVVAAVKHHIIDKDATLARMLGRAAPKNGKDPQNV